MELCSFSDELHEAHTVLNKILWKENYKSPSRQFFLLLCIPLFAFKQFLFTRFNFTYLFAIISKPEHFSDVCFRLMKVQFTRGFTVYVAVIFLTRTYLDCEFVFT